MDQHYRLVFRGEVLDGQHAAVVKKRLIGLLKVDDARAEKLFSGRPVVVVRDADKKTAARYQKAFKDLGARLRVLPIDDEPAPVERPTSLGAASPAPVIEVPDFGLAPVGADLAARRPIDTADDLPDTSHLTLAEVGVRLSDQVALAAIVEIPDVEFELAEAGAALGNVSERPPVLEIDVDFELAEVGSVLSPPRQADAAPALPPTEHLSLVEEPA